MIKRYATYSLRLNVSIKLGGKIVNVFFGNRNSESKTFFYDTSNEEEQKALESTRDFGAYYWLESEFQKEDIEEEDSSTLIVKEFDNINQAKDFLAKEHGVDLKKIASPKAFSNKVAELGYEFKILTSNN